MGAQLGSSWGSSYVGFTAGFSDDDGGFSDGVGFSDGGFSDGGFCTVGKFWLTLGGLSISFFFSDLYCVVRFFTKISGD
jgi:hypothetical protein